MKQWVLIAFLGVGLLTLCGCPNSSDSNTIANAQACLDQSNQTTASSCATMVNGITSPDAYVIRCSADFISQGFTASAMANVYQQLKNTSGNAGVLAMLGFMTFDTQTNATTALSDCGQSDVQSFALLASLADMATFAAYASGSYSGSPNRTTGFSSIAAGIASLDSTSTGQAEVGNVVLEAYNSTCGEPAYSSSQMCSAVVQSVQQGGTSAATVGHMFMSAI